MNNFAIRCRNLSKRFKIYDDMVTGPMREALFFWRKNSDRTKHYKEIVAVDDVSFEVRKGEVFGIIGPNGAGKTTLLKMIAGLLQCDDGEVEIAGRVSALLVQGAAMHPEMSGRENIFQNGLLLGMTVDEIAEMTPKIIEFAELGEYIDLPYRTYSAGMQTRLLFSISMSFTPDVMIIDEGLSAGDAFFIHKCRRKIREICESGVTLLIVSHDLTQVRSLCDRAILLNEGCLLAHGPTIEVIAAYDDLILEREANALESIHGGGLIPTPRSTGAVMIEAVRLVGVDDGVEPVYFTGRPLRIELDYKTKFDSATEVRLFIGFTRFDDGEFVGFLNFGPFSSADAARTGRVNCVTLGEEGTIVSEIKNLLLSTNRYCLWIIIYDPEKERHLCEFRDVAPFFVSRGIHNLVRGATFVQPSDVSTTARDGASKNK